MKTSLLMLLCASCAAHAPLPKAARQPAARTQTVSDRAAIINPPPTVTVSWAYPLEWETPDLCDSISLNKEIEIADSEFNLAEVVTP